MNKIQIIIKINRGKPTKEQLHQIIDMIVQGFNVGIDQPEGISWELSYKGKGTYDYIQNIIE